jgi:hypothetical protein
MRVAIRIGQITPIEEPAAIFPAFSRQTFSRHFHVLEAEGLTEIIARYQEFNDVCLGLDAGSIKARPMLTFDLTNAHSQLRRFAINLIPDFTGFKDDCILESLQPLLKPALSALFLWDSFATICRRRSAVLLK